MANPNLGAFGGGSSISSADSSDKGAGKVAAPAAVAVAVAVVAAAGVGRVKVKAEVVAEFKQQQTRINAVRNNPIKRWMWRQLKT
jgi:hypothetical protein